MIRTTHLKRQHFQCKRQFKEFIFIGKTSDNSVASATKQLNLYPNSVLVSQATVEDSLLITEVCTNKNVAHQLKNLEIKPGVGIELVSKTNSGSVVVSFHNKLVGIGAEIARQIVATPVC